MTVDIEAVALAAVESYHQPGSLAETDVGAWAQDFAARYEHERLTSLPDTIGSVIRWGGASWLLSSSGLWIGDSTSIDAFPSMFQDGDWTLIYDAGAEK